MKNLNVKKQNKEKTKRKPQRAARGIGGRGKIFKWIMRAQYVRLNLRQHRPPWIELNWVELKTFVFPHQRNKIYTTQSKEIKWTCTKKNWLAELLKKKIGNKISKMEVRKQKFVVLTADGRGKFWIEFQKRKLEKVKLLC